MILDKARERIKRFAAFCTVGAGMLLLARSEVAAQGVRRGIELCLETVIPSLFIFMIFCDLFAGLGNGNILLRPFGWLACAYRLPKAAAPALLLGVIGGYPIGARMAVKMQGQGKLSRLQAERLLTVAYCASPAFMAGAGRDVFGNGRLGLVLWGCQLAAGLLTGLIMSCFFPRGQPSAARPEEKPVRSGFTGAVVSAVRGMGVICGFVVAFSAVGSYLELLPGGIGRWITAGLEVSVGCSAAKGLPFYPALLCMAGCCSLGGVSVWLQNACFLRGSGISMRLFGLSRMIHLPLSLLITLAAERIFDFSGWMAGAVYAGFEGAVPSIGSGNLVSSVFLVVCCLMLLPGGQKV